MTTSTINFKIDDELKKEFQKLSKELGLTTTSFLTMFVKKAVTEQGAPFEVRVQNKVYKQLWQEEQEKILGIIEDDAKDIPGDYFEKVKAKYTHD